MKTPLNFLTKYFLLIMISSGLISGCSSLYEPTPNNTVMDGSHVISATASIRHIAAMKKDDPYVVCSEPPPDAVFAQKSSLSFSLFGDVGNSKEGDTSGSSESEMSGRLQSVLLVRELLFRLCEFSRNNQLTSEESVELYKQNLSLIQAVAVIEAQNTKITRKESMTTTISEEADNNQPPVSQIDLNPNPAMPSIQASNSIPDSAPSSIPTPMPSSIPDAASSSIPDAAPSSMADAAPSSMPTPMPVSIPYGGAPNPYSIPPSN